MISYLYFSSNYIDTWKVIDVSSSHRTHSIRYSGNPTVYVFGGYDFEPSGYGGHFLGNPH